MWTLLVAVEARAQSCPGRFGLLAELELSLSEGRFDDARTTHEALLKAFGCGQMAEPEVVARTWLANAMILNTDNAADRADDALRAAGVVAPDLWLDVYGADLRKRWFVLRNDALTPGRIELDPLPEGYVIAVDGQPLAPDGLVSSGLHIAQAGPSLSSIEFSAEVKVTPDEVLVVPTDLRRRRRVVVDKLQPRVPVFLVLSGVTAVGAATTAGLAANQNQRMREAPTQQELTAAFRSQRTFGIASYALMGATALGVGLHVAL